MKFWGSNKKQRNSIWVMLALTFIVSMMWKYSNTYRHVEDDSVDLVLNVHLIAIILFYIYLLFDNSRSTDINFNIKGSKFYLDKIVKKYNMEFNDILCRTHIANEIKDYLKLTSNKNYNYNVIDKTTNDDVDNIRCVYEIWADNQFRATYTILRNNTTILI